MLEDPSGTYLSMDTTLLQRMIVDRLASSQRIEQQMRELPAGSTELDTLKDRLWAVKAELLEMNYALDLKNSCYYRELHTQS